MRQVTNYFETWKLIVELDNKDYRVIKLNDFLEENVYEELEDVGGMHIHDGKLKWANGFALDGDWLYQYSENLEDYL